MWRTYTGFLLDDLQDPLGGQQEVHEAAQAVPPVLPLHHTEELPQHGGRGHAEGSVHGRQGALDAVVQRLSVLTGETNKSQRWLKRKCFIRRPKFSSGSCRLLGHIKAKDRLEHHAASRPFIRQPFQERQTDWWSFHHFTSNSKKKSNQRISFFFFFCKNLS